MQDKCPNCGQPLDGAFCQNCGYSQGVRRNVWIAVLIGVFLVTPFALFTGCCVVLGTASLNDSSGVPIAAIAFGAAAVGGLFTYLLFRLMRSYL